MLNFYFTYDWLTNGTEKRGRGRKGMRGKGGGDKGGVGKGVKDKGIFKGETNTLAAPPIRNGYDLSERVKGRVGSIVCVKVKVREGKGSEGK